MFSAGLSLDQAPPISVILRFFLTVPLFGIAAGSVLIAGHSDLLSGAQSFAFISLVHLVLLGMAAQTMTGALFQMLPVIAGAAIEHPLRHARIVHLLLTLGSAMIVAAFWSMHFGLLAAGAFVTVSVLLFFALTMLKKLFAVDNKTAAVRGMTLALVSLTVAALAALAMGYEFGTGDFFDRHGALRQLHLHFMLFGWIMGLIVAVSFQVIEMFYVTPPYPKRMQRYFLAALFGVLALQGATALFSPDNAVILDAIIAAMLLVFAAVTLRRLGQRKRPVADATVWLWRTGLVSFVAAVMLYPLDGLGAGMVFGYGVLAIIYAMSYKIVPFLVWFHLNAKGVMECPMMGDVISAKHARYHLQLYWSVGALLAGALLMPDMFIAAGALFILLNLFYAYNLGRAAKIYFELKGKGLIG